MQEYPKHLTSVWQTTDGKVFGSREEAENYQNTVLIQNTFSRVQTQLLSKWRSNNYPTSAFIDALKAEGVILTYKKPE